jgi:deoxyribose-phosphate aldolase
MRFTNSSIGFPIAYANYEVNVFELREFLKAGADVDVRREAQFLAEMNRMPQILER